ncbi:hypothetical protein [Halopseudomonas xiamenensis]|uniref:hypothetical protein n=1 Tax=Halopseudomonas xiamenensis TaxID=157792 RepID=UPI001627BC44|nr:hypothetical protein [Halopseudomonas xiamenensis]
MLESTRLDYLAAMGVTGWVPRHALPHAAFRLPPELPDIADEPQESAGDAIAVSPATVQIDTPKAAAPARAKIIVRPSRPEPAPATVVAPPAAEPEVKLPPLESFYLQLWMAGPCALLIETPEPGLESASPALRLLKDILRAVRLPQVPHLYADFTWPLNRNPQFDRSAPAASLALQAFMQGRLESEPVVSIGCFGTYPRLLLGPELDGQDLVCGREEALEQLPPAWFAPDLEALMKDSASKAQLWQQLKRIMSRWQVTQ